LFAKEKMMRMKTWSPAALLALAVAAPALAADPVGFVASDGVNTVPVTAATPLPVTMGAPPVATSTDASGTVAAGGTYQTVFAASPSRKGCLIQNPTTATEVLNIKVGAMASPFALPVGQTFSCANPGGLVITDAITITAATTSHAFAAVSQ
jgi:hypothetical protein